MREAAGWAAAGGADQRRGAGCGDRVRRGELGSRELEAVDPVLVLVPGRTYEVRVQGTGRRCVETAHQVARVGTVIWAIERERLVAVERSREEVRGLDQEAQ